MIDPMPFNAMKTTMDSKTNTKTTKGADKYEQKGAGPLSKNPGANSNKP